MTLVEEYRLLLEEIDSWFSRCQQQHPEEIACSKGCSECCRGLFDITMLDAAILNIGLAILPPKVRFKVRKMAVESVRTIQSSWPEFSQPFILNHRSEEERETLLASDNETPCVLLDNEGRCLLYDYRPMTCRLHGLPLIDVSGEIMESEWCTKNFLETDPLSLKNLRGEFERLLYTEAELGRCFTAELLGEALVELDTVIPTALLIDFENFDWRKWYTEKQIKT
jgi:Fe-S-cluster containining protein